MFFDKKTKRERIDYQMIIENTFCDYLDAKAKEGLVFSSIGMEDVVFIIEDPCNKKYQIEYGLTEYEYDDYLEDIGYKLVSKYKNMTIYANDNINAPDFHTDEDVRLNAAKNMVGKNSMAVFCVLSIFIIPFIIGGIFLITSEIKRLTDFVDYYGIVLLVIFLITGYIGVILKTMQSAMVKNIINKVVVDEDVEYKRLNKVTKLYRNMLHFYGIEMIIITICVIPIVFSNVSEFMLSLVVRTTLYGLIYLLAKVMMKMRVDKKAILGICALLFVAVHTVADAIIELFI